MGSVDYQVGKKATGKVLVIVSLILSQKVCLKGSKKGPTLAWQP